MVNLTVFGTRVGKKEGVPSSKVRKFLPVFGSVSA